MKSLVGAISAMGLFALLVRPRPGMAVEDVSIRGGERGAPVEEWAVETEYFRLRAVYCPTCGRHRTEAVDAVADWPASVPHEECCPCRRGAA